MKDLNLVRLTGTIFWSKLDDRQTFSILRLGVKLEDGASLFCSVNNPSTKVYDLIKAGNKIIVTGGYLDTWEKQDGSSELQVKCNDSSIAFYPKEKALININSVSVVGKIVSYDGDNAVIEMVGERSPKTDKPSVRKAKIKIGGAYGQEVLNSKIMLEAKITSAEVEGKSKMAVEANYDQISII